MQSVHNISSLLLIPSQTFPLLPCGVPVMASAPYGLLQCGSFPQAAVLEELLQSGSFSRGVVLQEWIALVWGPHRPQIQKTCSCVDSSPEATVSARSLFSRGCSFLQNTSTCCSMGCPEAAVWYLLHHGPPQAAGDPLFWGLEQLPPFLVSSAVSCDGSTGAGWNCASSTS